MALIRFGDQAFNWDRVYAAIVLEQETSGQVKTLSLFCDIPGASPGTATARLFGRVADDAWLRAENDDRFTKIDSPRLAIDLARVQLVAVDSKTKTGMAIIELEKDRGGPFEISAEAAEAILQSLK